MAGLPVGANGYMDIAYLDTIGACRIGCRRPDLGRRDLAEPTCASEGKPARPRNGAARRSLPGVHCRGIESIRRSHCEQRAKGIRCPLRHDQQDAAPVAAANRRVRREDHAGNNLHLVRRFANSMNWLRGGRESICRRTSAKSRARSCGHSQRCNGVYSPSKGLRTS